MINRQNYHLVKEYLGSPENASACVESLERYSSYLRHLLIWADEEPLNVADTIEPTLMEYVRALKNRDHSDKSASPETKKKIVTLSKSLFEWARLKYPDRFGALSYGWIKGLMAEKIPNVYIDHVYVTEEMALQVAAMPIDEEDVQTWRDQAAHAFGYLSGIRGGAFVTMPVKAVNLDEMTVKQYRELDMNVKNGKGATTFLLQIPPLLEVVRMWDEFVRKQFGPNALWYPNIDQRWGGVKRADDRPGANRIQSWNDRLGLLYKRTGLPYLSSHKLRHGFAVYGLEHARTMSDYKAVSQNLMHSDIKITDRVYAFLEEKETKKRILALSDNPTHCPDHELSTFLSRLSKNDLSEAIQISAKLLANM